MDLRAAAAVVNLICTEGFFFSFLAFVHGHWSRDPAEDHQKEMGIWFGGERLLGERRLWAAMENTVDLSSALDILRWIFILY